MYDTEETEEERLKRVIKEAKQRLKNLEHSSYLTEITKAETLKRKRKPIIFDVDTKHGSFELHMYKLPDVIECDSALRLKEITYADYTHMMEFIESIPWIGGCEE